MEEIEASENGIRLLMDPEKPVKATVFRRSIVLNRAGFPLGKRWYLVQSLTPDGSNQRVTFSSDLESREFSFVLQLSRESLDSDQ